MQLYSNHHRPASMLGLTRPSIRSGEELSASLWNRHTRFKQTTGVSSKQDKLHTSQKEARRQRNNGIKLCAFIHQPVRWQDHSVALINVSIDPNKQKQYHRHRTARSSDRRLPIQAPVRAPQLLVWSRCQRGGAQCQFQQMFCFFLLFLLFVFCFFSWFLRYIPCSDSESDLTWH